MEIRFEKVEIKISDAFVETIGNGLLRLKSFDAEMNTRESNTKNNLMVSLIGAGFGMLRDAMMSNRSNGKPSTPAAAPAPAKGEGDESESAGASA